MVTGVVTGLLMVRVMELPDLDMPTGSMELQPVTPVGMAVGLNVLVGVFVMVGVNVIVGLSVMVGVRLGVKVNSSVGDGVMLGVVVGVSDGSSVGLLVKVGVVGGSVGGGIVTWMEIATRTVRALLPTIGSGGISDDDREINGTSFGMMGKKSPSILTTMRWLLPDGLKPVGSTATPPRQYSVSFNPRGEGGFGP